MFAILVLCRNRACCTLPSSLGSDNSNNSDSLSLPIYIMQFQNRALASFSAKSSKFYSKQGCVLAIVTLLLLAGDIEVNPGPRSSMPYKEIKLFHLNIALVCEKSAPLQNLVIDNSLDILALIEIWLKPSDHSLRYPPSGSLLLGEPCQSEKGGGVAFVYRSHMA